eukprot:Nk52_evm14s348 gene=Nk52_evmTU14s348
MVPRVANYSHPKSQRLKFESFMNQLSPQLATQLLPRLFAEISHAGQNNTSEEVFLEVARAVGESVLFIRGLATYLQETVEVHVGGRTGRREVDYHNIVNPIVRELLEKEIVSKSQKEKKRGRSRGDIDGASKSTRGVVKEYEVVQVDSDTSNSNKSTVHVVRVVFKSKGGELEEVFMSVSKFNELRCGVAEALDWALRHSPPVE